MPEVSAELEDAELERYGRHVMLDGIGIEGQQKIRAARALVVGVGGLGCPAALYLASCGIGSMALADDDTVETSNLQRQILFRDGDVGRPKSEVAARELAAINPHVSVEHVSERATAENLPEMCDGADVVLDCSDNFETRHAVNEACLNSRTDLVGGAAEQFDGQVYVFPFSVGTSPCYGCLYPKRDSNPEQTPCALLGVLAPLTGAVGSLMACEALRLVAGLSGDGLKWRMLALDTLGQRVRSIRIRKDPECKACR